LSYAGAHGKGQKKDKKRGGVIHISKKSDMQVAR